MTAREKMGIVFSKEQNDVICLRNRNILVSAAAGSGKTTVLVERIIRMISDEEHPVDIDHLLIVTFTKAAAASMREKISDAIAKKLEEEYSEHLQRQATLLHHAQITTIDSFCLFILQNNFNDIGLDPGFRVADESEMLLLKEDIMEQLLEERLLAAKEGQNDFTRLLDRFVPGKRISAIRDVLLTFYRNALSNPFPKDWITARKDDYAIKSEEELESCVWIQQLIRMVKRDIGICFDIADKNRMLAGESAGPATYLPMLDADYNLAEKLLKADSFEELHREFQVLEFETLSRKKDPDADPDIKEYVKKQRDVMKDILKGLQKDYFSYSTEELLGAFAENDRIVKELCETLLDYHTRLMTAKREKKIIDFSDMEHYALEILLQKENGGYVPTKTALEYRKYFQEIMIDEYQDSNSVQEWLLQAISGESDGNYNRFMVGDVKQSIYQFRLARPQIFMEKYDTYTKEVREDVCLQRIDLAKNYRSRKEVVEGVNSIFYRIMGRDLGNVSYDEESALYLGAGFPVKNGEQDGVELCLIQKEENDTDKKEQEARLVAHRIKKLVGNYDVTDDGGGFKKAGYGDIVILLRNLKGWDEAFKNVFEEEGIPLYVEKSTGYFETTEIRVLLNFLKTLDNPKQDIPLFGTMTSWFGKFNNEEIALLQSLKKSSLYVALKYLAENGQSAEEKSEMTEDMEVAEEKSGAADGQSAKKKFEAAADMQKQWHQLSVKCRDFLTWFSSYRGRIAYEPIHKILRELLNETGYLYEMASLPGGEQRVANVSMLLAKAEGFEKSSYSGLFHFIRYIEKIQKYDVEFGEAGLQEEGADVVRMMTIHKSKGLEFPICMICGLAGQFNMTDMGSELVCESDYGVGMDYVDIEKRIKYRDIRRRFLAKYMQEERMGEELRILYVAMTRAKEKLIMTGLCKDLEKWEDAEEVKTDGNGILSVKIPELLSLQKRMNAKCYLDWIREANSPLVNVRIITAQELTGESVKQAVKEQFEKQSLLSLLQSENREDACGLGTDRETKENIRFDFSYPHTELNGLYTKTSVSELKLAHMHKAYEKESEEEAFVPLFPTEEIVPYIPSFAKEKQEVSGVARGSAYHRVLELFEYARLSKEEMQSKEGRTSYIQHSVENMVMQGRITEEAVSMIDGKKISLFLESPVAMRMSEAAKRGELHKEQPFVLGIEANRLSEDFPETEKVLIQGIIDVYFVEENEIVLLDYKTDRIHSGEELAERYRTQIDYYTEALERITGLHVKERILYSFALGKEVRV